MNGVKKNETHPLHGQVGELVAGDSLDDMEGFSQVRFGLNSVQWVQNRFLWPIESKKEEEKKHEQRSS